MALKNQTTMIRARVSTTKRLDKIAPKLQAKRGGSWSRGDVIDEAVDALERELKQPENLTAETQTLTPPKGQG
jgi:hypothetical protein